MELQIEPGQTLGRYRILSVLGAGAMGKVFRAEDALLKRHVALKILPKPLVNGQRTVAHEQFIREARYAAQLDHPHIVRVYDAGRDRGLVYISMELVDGGTLDSIVKAGGALDVARACQLTAEAAEALAYAHEHSIVHRDVKPSNLLLARGGRCKLSDFGLAKIDDPEDLFRLPTETVGTPLFASPEIFRGKPATPASDVYSLSATAYVLLTRKGPFPTGTLKEIALQHVQIPPPDIRLINPNVPEGLALLLLQGLSKDPGKRQSADHFAKALRAFSVAVPGAGSSTALHGTVSGSVPTLTASSIAITPVTGTEPPAITAHSLLHNRVLLAILGGLVLTMFLLTGLIALLMLRPQAPSPEAPASVETAQAPEKPAAPGAPLPPDGIVPWTRAAEFVNKEITVEGKVIRTSIAKINVGDSLNRGSITFLNFSNDPNAFYVEVYPPADTLQMMATSTAVLNRNVRITGKVMLYNFRPYLRVDKRSQIEVLK